MHAPNLKCVQWPSQSLIGKHVEIRFVTSRTRPFSNLDTFDAWLTKAVTATGYLEGIAKDLQTDGAVCLQLFRALDEFAIVTASISRGRLLSLFLWCLIDLESWERVFAWGWLRPTQRRSHFWLQKYAGYLVVSPPGTLSLLAGRRARGGHETNTRGPGVDLMYSVRSHAMPYHEAGAPVAEGWAFSLSMGHAYKVVSVMIWSQWMIYPQSICQIDCGYLLKLFEQMIRWLNVLELYQSHDHQYMAIKIVHGNNLCLANGYKATRIAYTIMPLIKYFQLSRTGCNAYLQPFCTHKFFLAFFCS